MRCYMYDDSDSFDFAQSGTVLKIVSYYVVSGKDSSRPPVILYIGNILESAWSKISVNSRHEGDLEFPFPTTYQCGLGVSSRERYLRKKG